MRVTNSFRTDQTLRDLQGNLSRLIDLQSQIATGKKFTSVEQNPAGAAQVMRFDRGIRALDQYDKNATNAQVRLGAEEAVAQQVNDLVKQGQNFALSFAKGDPPYTTDQTQQRLVAADQLSRLLDEAISLGNTKIGGEYILGGAASTTPPFDPTAGATYGDYQGSTIVRKVEIAAGVQVTPNHTGDQFVGPAIAALKALRDAVDPANNQTEAQVQTAAQAVAATADGLLLSQAQTGTTSAQINSTQASNATVRTNTLNAKTGVQDVAPEEAITRLLSLQTTVQASYSATSRLLGLSLTDYLG